MDASPLSTLPAELRNEIYTLATPRLPTPIIITFPFEDYGQPFFETPLPEHALALTEVCSAIRQETLGTFFAMNSFKISPLADSKIVRRYEILDETEIQALRLSDWLGQLDPKNLQALGCIEIDLGRWTYNDRNASVQKPSRDAQILTSMLFQFRECLIFRHAGVSAVAVMELEDLKATRQKGIRELVPKSVPLTEGQEVKHISVALERGQLHGKEMQVGEMLAVLRRLTMQTFQIGCEFPRTFDT